MKPHLENVQGYTLVKTGDKSNALGERAAEYLFTLDLVNPLTFHDGKGGKYQPNRKYKSDMGTIPKLLQRIVAKDKYLLSFLFHDSCWEHGGVWYCAPGYETYAFVKMNRTTSNRLLKDMVLVEGKLYEGIKPAELKRDAKWIKAAVDLYAFWARISRRVPRHKRLS